MTTENNRRTSGPVRATLADVARAAGVSINTASRAFRAPQTVRPQLRQEIEAAANALYYLPNRLAGGLAGARTDIVGVIIPSLFYSEFAETLEAMQTTLEAAGLVVMLGNSSFDPEEELRLARAMLSWRPAGIGLVGVDHHPEVKQLIKREQLPLVEFWDVCEECQDCAVGMDHRAIGVQQADHLIDQGCRRIAYIGCIRSGDHRSQKRLDGCSASVRERLGTEIHRAIAADAASPAAGNCLAGALLRQHGDVDGIICNGDVVAYGVLHALREAGRAVPRQVKVIGFGDRSPSEYVLPSLSSIRPPRTDIGIEAARMLLQRIDTGQSAIRTFETKLVARQSTAQTDGVS
ncbi:MAG: LacI family DNA-binding transcriptional regulator [Geminicoccaceae bacterium]|nr:LacI family DNA-binding transcriptional regulator [Geminicoccaceae bacterium]